MLGRRLLEHRDELAADDLPLLLRIGHPGELRRGSASRASTVLQRHVEAIHEERLHLRALALPQQRRCPRRCTAAASPMARCSSSAATELSTPPDSPQMTRPSSPTWRRIASCASCDEALHRPGAAHPAVGEEEGAQHLLARAGCGPPRGGTAGRRWARVRVRRRGEGRVAAAADGLEARRAASSTRSPWLIHTLTLLARREGRRAGRAPRAPPPRPRRTPGAPSDPPVPPSSLASSCRP